jgi:hypothetical protein
VVPLLLVVVPFVVLAVLLGPLAPAGGGGLGSRLSVRRVEMPLVLSLRCTSRALAAEPELLPRRSASPLLLLCALALALLAAAMLLPPPLLPPLALPVPVAVPPPPALAACGGGTGTMLLNPPSNTRLCTPL